MVSEERISQIIAHSFKNFHAKGMDYICLDRSPAYTRKAYFLNGDATKLPEVVNPHEHRYHFKTRVLCGVMSNSEYEPVDDGGQVYQEFEWRTPLNGGDGFTWKQETRLFETKRFFYRHDGSYFMRAEDFHTIRMHADQTILILDQYADVVPVDVPTRTFIPERKAPNLDGLYERFNADEVLDRLETLASFGVLA